MLKLIKLIVAPFILLPAILFTACDDNDNVTVPEQIMNTFAGMYPDAKSISWEMEHGYYVADFWRTDMKAEAEAWFSSEKGWVMTATEIHFNALPEGIRHHFTAGDYAGWRIDGILKVERSGSDTVYVIEVENQNREFHLYYREDGTFIKAVADNGRNKTPADYI